ncbi:MAG: hypothetical protein AABZ74_05610 [Cyanobacteriota bacterium]
MVFYPVEGSIASLIPNTLRSIKTMIVFLLLLNKDNSSDKNTVYFERFVIDNIIDKMNLKNEIQFIESVPFKDRNKHIARIIIGDDNWTSELQKSKFSLIDILYLFENYPRDEKDINFIFALKTMYSILLNKLLINEKYDHILTLVRPHRIEYKNLNENNKSLFFKQRKFYFNTKKIYRNFRITYKYLTDYKFEILNSEDMRIFINKNIHIIIETYFDIIQILINMNNTNNTNLLNVSSLLEQLKREQNKDNLDKLKESMENYLSDNIFKINIHIFNNIKGLFEIKETFNKEISDNILDKEIVNLKSFCEILIDYYFIGDERIITLDKILRTISDNYEIKYFNDILKSKYNMTSFKDNKDNILELIEWIYLFFKFFNENKIDTNEINDSLVSILQSFLENEKNFTYMNLRSNEIYITEIPFIEFYAHNLNEFKEDNNKNNIIEDNNKNLNNENDIPDLYTDYLNNYNYSMKKKLKNYENKFSLDLSNLSMIDNILLNDLIKFNFSDGNITFNSLSNYIYIIMNNNNNFSLNPIFSPFFSNKEEEFKHHLFREFFSFIFSPVNNME